MKKNLFPYALIGVTLLGLALTPIAARAIDGETSSEKVTIPSDRTIEDDFAAAANEIDMAGRIEGGLFATGQNIHVSGPVTESIFAGGSEVSLDAPVGDDLWAAGGSLMVRGPVAHNVGLAGGTIQLQREASIGRDALLAGGSATIDGPVERNLTFYGTTATLSNRVGGDVTAHADHVTLHSTAVVEGDLTVYGAFPPVLEEGATVKGQVHYHPRTETEHKPTPMQKFRNWTSGWMYQFGATLVLGFTLLALFPMHVARVSETLLRRTGKSFLIGSLAMIAVPLSALVMTVTLIGIPLAVSVSALYIVALLTANAAVAYLVGTWVTQLTNHPAATKWARFAIGAAIVSLIASLPYLGGVAEGVFLALGSGATLLYCHSLIKGER